MDTDETGRMILPAITLWQPWATWIADGLRTIETRTHSRFRSLLGKRIAIHAGLRWDDEALDDALAVCPVIFRSTLIQSTEEARDVRGAVVCTAYVRDFRPLVIRDSADSLVDIGQGRRYGLVLEDVRSFTPPVRAGGHQGIWQWTVGIGPPIDAAQGA